MELIKELGLDVHKQYSTGAKFARLSDGKVRKYSSSLPKISLFSLLDIFFFINKVRCVGDSMVMIVVVVIDTMVYMLVMNMVRIVVVNDG